MSLSSESRGRDGDALGLNLLTRLTTALDLIAGGVFLLALLWSEQVRGLALSQRLLAYCRIAAPIYAFFLLAKRLYNFYRLKGRRSAPRGVLAPQESAYGLRCSTAESWLSFSLRFLMARASAVQFGAVAMSIVRTRPATIRRLGPFFKSCVTHGPAFCYSRARKCTNTSSPLCRLIKP
jgi:hypothetical protein